MMKTGIYIMLYAVPIRTAQPFRELFKARLPYEFITIEFLYFLFIVSLCILIYYKTKEIYDLTKHKGIFFFRQTFLFFALAYFFRMVHLFIFTAKETMDLAFPRTIFIISLVFVAYFSIIAVFSLALTVVARKINLKAFYLNIGLHVFTIMLAVVVSLIYSSYLLLLLQLAVFLFVIIYYFIRSRERETSKFFSRNHITMILLFLFWLINIVALARNMIPLSVRIIMYALSACIFFSVYKRVCMRLPANAKKKRSS